MLAVLAAPYAFGVVAIYGLTRYAAVDPAWGGGAAQVVRFRSRHAGKWGTFSELPGAAALLDQDGQVATVLACAPPDRAPARRGRLLADVDTARPGGVPFVRTVLLSDETSMLPFYVRHDSAASRAWHPPLDSALRRLPDDAGRGAVDADPLVIPLPSAVDTSRHRSDKLDRAVCTFLHALVQVPDSVPPRPARHVRRRRAARRSLVCEPGPQPASAGPNR